MGEQFWWIYDIACAVILVLCIYFCSKKGFSKIVILCIGCVVSLVVSSFASKSLAPFVYDKFIKKTITETVEKSLDGYDTSEALRTYIEQQDYGVILEDGKLSSIIKKSKGDCTDEIYDYVREMSADDIGSKKEFENVLSAGLADVLSSQFGKELPPYVTNEVSDRITGSSDTFKEVISQVVLHPLTAPEYIEESFAREPATRLVRFFMFLVCYFLMMTIIRIVVNKGEGFGLLNGYDTLDKIVGGVFGIFEYAAVMLVIAVIIKIMIYLADSDGSFLSRDTISKTIIFKYIYDLI